MMISEITSARPGLIPASSRTGTRWLDSRDSPNAADMKPAAVTTSYEDAAAASGPMTKQQSKMTTCNTEAGDKKGDERKAFMKSCLSAKKTTQQDRMKSCNKEAGDKSLKGDDRKKFMSDCLKAA